MKRRPDVGGRIVDSRTDLATAGTEKLAAAGKMLEKEIKSLIGISAAVKVAPVDGADRSMGKARRVVDLRASA